ncbi:zinc finger SWIM domain-containing protein 6-like [Ostrinia furnacalis]|uniref:zinc finger SWIM domain-containing protein 6-like n=1 Tax=Ostrinia furnacalis TaxID=93504 RepID=UPI00103F9CB7|nr:zinc finger SWIM domain-containing protein 6-like [Ostrinia furnacalis]
MYSVTSGGAVGGAAGAGGSGGGRGGSLRTPLARTPVTFNASQVAKAKLQAALSEESGSASGVSGVSGAGCGGRGAYWAAKLPHLPAPS